MKKWLIGCLLTGLILSAIAGGLFYWLVWPRLSSAGGDLISNVSDLKKLGEAEQAIRNQSAFSAPADGKLSQAQVAAFMAIQQSIMDRMGPDFAMMEEKYKHMSEQQTRPEDANLKDVMGAYADLTSLMAKARQAQVEGLNAQNMSKAEYQWIREQVSAAMPYLTMEGVAESTGATLPEAPVVDGQNAAAGEAAAASSVDDAIAQAKQQAAESMKQNVPGSEQIQEAMQGMDSEAIRANAELLRPHKELILKTITAAWMGM